MINNCFFIHIKIFGNFCMFHLYICLPRLLQYAPKNTDPLHVLFRKKTDKTGTQRICPARKSVNIIP
jgi:hypothetical protein